MWISLTFVLVNPLSECSKFLSDLSHPVRSPVIAAYFANSRHRVIFLANNLYAALQRVGLICIISASCWVVSYIQSIRYFPQYLLQRTQLRSAAKLLLIWSDLSLALFHVVARCPSLHCYSQSQPITQVIFTLPTATRWNTAFYTCFRSYIRSLSPTFAIR